MARKEDILHAKPVVINLGIKEFAEDLVKQNVRVVFVKWKPPAHEDSMSKLLENLL